MVVTTQFLCTYLIHFEVITPSDHSMLFVRGKPASQFFRMPSISAREKFIGNGEPRRTGTPGH